MGKVKKITEKIDNTIQKFLDHIDTDHASAKKKNEHHVQSR